MPKICAIPTKPLPCKAFRFDGLNSPTLKVASSNLVSRTKKSVSRQGCGLFDMIAGNQTCGLQVRSTFNPLEAVRRAAPSQVASSNLVSRTKNEDFLWKILVFAYKKSNFHSSQIAVNSSGGNSAEGYRRGGVAALLYTQCYKIEKNCC